MRRRERLKEIEFLSVIIPCFKQEKSIQQYIKKVELALLAAGYPYEIIVVIDGKADKTFEKAARMESNTVKVIGYEKNHGKGYAVRFGMVRAKGDIVGFIDAGTDLNPNGLSMLLEHFKWYDADIIIGSKRHPVSKVNYPFDRKIISYTSQLFIRLLFGISVRDTQVGMKFFRREVLEDVLPRLLVKKFAFDIETLVVAHSLGYKRIFEAPVELNFRVKESTVSQNLFVILLKTFWDTLAIFYRLKILNYYNATNKRKWKFDPQLQFKVNIG